MDCQDESTCHFVCSRGLLKSCTFHSYNPRSSCSNDISYLIDMLKSDKMYNGMSIYICTDLLPFFAKTVLSKLKNTFYLVSGDSDTTVPAEVLTHIQYNYLINHSLLIKWFIQNTTIQDCPKICQLPIGLDYHTIASDPTHPWTDDTAFCLNSHLPKSQEAVLTAIRDTALPFWERPVNIYINFTTRNDRFNQRNVALQQIPNHLLAINQVFTPRTQNWKNIAHFAFALSPFGNGMDCHRTWEILCLGAIPIVCAPQFKQLFADLPVLNVDSWTEISEELLYNTVDEFSKKTFKYEKLTLAYWRNQFRT
jgi:hypothetical protein